MKKVMSIFKYTLLFAVVFSLWVLSGCSSSSDPAPTKNIIDLIGSTDFKESATVTDDKALDSLAKYIANYPDLVTLLSGTTQYTVFAPSNKAFKNLLATPGFPSNIALINPDIIKGVLSYHVVADQKLQSTLTNGTTLTTLYSDPVAGAQTIVMNADGTLKTGSTNQAIAITVADKKATNGVVHVTASVLIPPSVGATLTPILGTIAGSVLLGKDFSYLAALIKIADTGFTEGAGLGDRKISTLLAIPATTANFPGATFFAPPNAVITAAAGGSANVAAFLATFTPTTARALLLNHYVLGKYLTTGSNGTTSFPIANGGSATALSTGKLYFLTGLPVSANNPYGIVVTTDVNTTAKYAPIVIKDFAHSNGVLHAIAGILQ